MSRVVVFPYWKQNPFTDLLYMLVRSDRHEVVEPTRFEQLERDVEQLAQGDVLHIQWTTPICQPAKDIHDAQWRLQRFRSFVTKARSRGVKIVWTIHNVVPHDVRFIEVERSLAAFLSDVADAVHVLSNETIAEINRHHSLPVSKIRTIPHCSYLGIYPSSVTRAEARANFGIGEDEKVVASIGQMRPYKGLGALLRAVEMMPAAVAPTVLLAGKASAEDQNQVESAIAPGMKIVRHFGFVADEDLQLWMRAADLVVLPYAQVLNSGSIFLAASFGVPVLAPDLSSLVSEYRGLDWIEFYSAHGGPEALSAAITRFTPDQALSASALDFATSRSPYAMAEAFLSLIRELSDRA